jgi:hypothetical protein
MPAMFPRTLIEAVKRWMWRELRVLGLYALWRSLGGTIWLAVVGLLMLGGVKYFAETPPEFFFVPVVPAVSTSQTLSLPPIMNMPFLQRSTATFFRGLPYIGPLYEYLPLFNHRDPWSYMVWGPLFPLGWLGTHLLRRKVKEGPLASSINNTYHGDIGMVNTGTMAVERIGSIAARLTRMSLPSQKETVQAIVKVAEAVREERAIDQTRRRENLDRLLRLAQQTELPAADRSPTAIHTIIKDLDSALSVAGKVASVWTQWGKIIKTFFDIAD